MSPEVPPAVLPIAAAGQPPIIHEMGVVPSPLRRVLFAPIKFLVGMLSCQSALGSLAVIGWTYRLMQRTVLKQWWMSAGQPHAAESLESFFASDSRTREHVHWPNWVLAQNFRETVRRDPQLSRGQHMLHVLKSIFQSLWINIRIGVQGIFNTWVLTLPGCVLWLFAWYAGWQNSFNKGYEEFWVGPAAGWLGIMLFIGAMLYVPMAQARHAVTGDWRRFYDFRLVWTLVRRRWPACFGLATLYALFSLPVMVLIFLPTGFPQMGPALGQVTVDQPEQVVRILRNYCFWSALIAFPAFVVVRVVAARIYGSGLLKAVQSGAIAEDGLSDGEWKAFNRLDLWCVKPAPQCHPVVRIIAWAGTRAGRITFGVATFLMWFVFVSQIFIAQFLKYNVGPKLWLNHPLVHLPWLFQVPSWIQNPWGQVFAAAVVVLVAWRLKKLVGRITSWRSPRPVPANSSAS